jgi:phage terminase Nu1 subunit (DNA packaging protein)
MKGFFEMATAVTAAKHICLGASRFRDLVAEGVFKRMPAGKYDLKTVRETYCLHMQKIASGRGADGGAALSAKRARLADAQAQAAEFKNAQMQGGFVELPVMKNLLTVMFGIIRERLLSMPGKIADSLTPHCAEDRATISDTIRTEVHDALTELHDPAGPLPGEGGYVDQATPGKKA